MVNAWSTLHQDGILPGLQPLLVMDVWEHAFMLDYGLERPKYLEAFFHNIDWSAVEKRFQGSISEERRKAA